MRVKSLSVDRLFGVFNHEVSLNDEDRITIIYGPNGFGKTFTLTLVDELLNPSSESYSTIARIPFERLLVTFDDGRSVTLEKREDGDRTKLSFVLSGKKGEIERHCYDSASAENASEPGWLHDIKRAVYIRFIHTERIKRLTAERWREMNESIRALVAEDGAKVDLYAAIINERFMHKDVVLDPEKGLLITTTDGRVLPPEYLSSGEQHVLYLYYELLFNIGPDSLILIDEPELSLHILWQQEFLSDLGRIIDLSEFDIVVATHSPQIIHDRWDLAVELKGPGE